MGFKIVAQMLSAYVFTAINNWGTRINQDINTFSLDRI